MIHIGSKTLSKLVGERVEAIEDAMESLDVSKCATERAVLKKSRIISYTGCDDGSVANAAWHALYYASLHKDVTVVEVDDPEGDVYVFAMTPARTTQYVCSLKRDKHEPV